MSVVIKLVKLMPDFSDAERAVAQYLIDHNDSVVKFSIEEIAINAVASTSTVVRMCKKLGFKGYKEFKIALILDLNQRKVNYCADNSVVLDRKNCLEIVAKNNILALEETLQLIDEKSVDDAIDIISKATNITVFGKGASNLVAQDLAMKFSRINVPVRKFIDTHDLLVNMANWNKSDALILVSHSGETNEVIKALSVAKEVGAKVIALVKYSRSTLSEGADVCLYTSSIEESFRAGALTSRMSQLCVVDMLYTSYITRNKEKSLVALNNSYKLISKYINKEGKGNGRK